MFTNYQQACQRLLSLQNLEVPWKHNDRASLQASFVRLRQLLARLGNPERAMRFIHVTGTSGKGSVTNLVHDMLRAEGRSVASYTSPHTTTLLERYRVNDTLLHPKAFVAAVDDVLAAYAAHIEEGKQPLSFFELTTCVTFVAFRAAKAQWCVLEVGLGGRWDSTNIITKTDVAVITNIDYDHVDILGRSLKKIAYEKAGIIKKGSVVIVGEQRRTVRAVIAKEAAKHGAPVQYVKLAGDDYRLHNALIAAAAAQHAGVGMEAIERALATTRGLPCRCEIIAQHPTVIVDGAHNEAKMRATVQRIKAMQPKRVHVVFGCKASKDAAKLAKALRGSATTVRTTRYTTGRGEPHNPARLLALFRKNQRAGVFLFPHDALADALAAAKNNDVVLVTGSLYLAGELRTRWVSEKQIIATQQSAPLLDAPR